MQFEYPDPNAVRDDKWYHDERFCEFLDQITRYGDVSTKVLELLALVAEINDDEKHDRPLDFTTNRILARLNKP